MKRYVYLLLAVPALAQGQLQNPDTLASEELQGITVTATSARAGASATVYIPASRQKDAASDGFGLLSRMAIPQLAVNPVTESVTTAAGHPVEIFINSQQASAEDVAALNPAEVLRVEYMDFPADPRYLRAQHVVNFVTRRLSSGGYTKLAARERFIVRGGDAALYSKLACREMEYDLALSGDYDYNGHTGSTVMADFSLPSGPVRRESSVSGGKYRRRGLFAGLRASWLRGDNFSFRNLLTFRRDHTPRNETHGIVTFAGAYPDRTYFSSSPSTANAVGWESALYAALRRGWSLNGSLEAEVRDNTAADTYRAASTDIVNHADENAWFARGNIQLDKALSERLTLFGNILSGGGRTHISYTGTDVAENRFDQAFAGISAGISLNGSKVSGSIDAGYAFETNTINDFRTDDSYPFTHISVQYAPDRRNSVGLWCQYASFTPDATMKNPNMLQLNELLYVSGNPKLRCSRHISASVSYTWLPSSRWQLTAYASVFNVLNRQISVYTPDAPGALMLKRYENDGDYLHGQLGARFSAKFLGDRLVLTAAPRLLLYKTTGSNSMSHYPLSGSVRADFYAGRFFFSAFWSSPWSYVDGDTAALSRIPQSFMVSAGWSWRGWNVELSAVNPWRSSWVISKDTLNTLHYSEITRHFGSDYHRRLTLSLTYTFKYGKKVAQGAELESAGAISSSILR